MHVPLGSNSRVVDDVMKWEKIGASMKLIKWPIHRIMHGTDLSYVLPDKWWADRVNSDLYVVTSSR
jgi:predicted TIM-barrel fold metal-dependent hydrolase